MALSKAQDWAHRKQAAEEAAAELERYRVSALEYRDPVTRTKYAQICESNWAGQLLEIIKRSDKDEVLFDSESACALARWILDVMEPENDPGRG